eukprot:458935_1
MSLNAMRSKMNIIYLLKVFIAVFLFVFSYECSNNTTSLHPIVQKLKNYVESNNTFALQLNETYIEEANKTSSNIMNYDNMYIFFNTILTTAPNVSNMGYPHITILEYVDTIIGNKLILQENVIGWFNQWLYVWKQYLDSFNSTNVLEGWYNICNMSEYIIPSNGYQSFNDFFIREIKPELRPISQPTNNSIITSPVDGEILFINYNINISNSYFNVKNVSYNLINILGDKSKAKLFE